MVRRVIVTFLLFAFTLATLSHGRVLDPTSPKNTVLDAVASALDGHGVDVLRSWSSSAASQTGVRLAPLDGFTHGVKWMTDFSSGAVGVLAAASGPHPSGDPFAKRWLSTPTDRRVFISFTSADSATAKVVKSELERAGFVAFVYLNDDGKPLYSAEVAGRLFAQAGHRVVLDTPNARRSTGVWFESRMLAALAPGTTFPFSRGPDPDLLGGGSPTKSPEDPSGGGVTGSAVLAGKVDFDRLPGGVVLGQTAKVTGVGAPLGRASGFSLRGTGSESVYLKTVGGVFPVTTLSKGDARACASFASSRTDHVAVNIFAETVPVRIGSRSFSYQRAGLYFHPALAGSAVGEALVWADMLPFVALAGMIPAGTKKSLIIDRSVRVTRASGAATINIDVDFDVRFYKRGANNSADVVQTWHYTASNIDGFKVRRYRIELGVCWP